MATSSSGSAVVRGRYYGWRNSYHSGDWQSASGSHISAEHRYELSRSFIRSLQGQFALRINSFGYRTSPVPLPTRPIMEAAAQALQRHGLTAGVYNTGGSRYCLIVSAGDYQLMLVDTAPQWRYTVLNDDDETLGCCDLKLNYQTDAVTLATRLRLAVQKLMAGTPAAALIDGDVA